MAHSKPTARLPRAALPPLRPWESAMRLAGPPPALATTTRVARLRRPTGRSWRNRSPQRARGQGRARKGDAALRRRPGFPLLPSRQRHRRHARPYHGPAASEGAARPSGGVAAEPAAAPAAPRGRARDREAPPGSRRGYPPGRYRPLDRSRPWAGPGNRHPSRGARRRRRRTGRCNADGVPARRR